VAFFQGEDSVMDVHQAYRGYFSQRHRLLDLRFPASGPPKTRLNAQALELCAKTITLRTPQGTYLTLAEHITFGTPGEVRLPVEAEDRAYLAVEDVSDAGVPPLASGTATHGGRA
jgi:hypothetical protein